MIPKDSGRVAEAQNVDFTPVFIAVGTPDHVVCATVFLGFVGVGSNDEAAFGAGGLGEVGDAEDFAGVTGALEDARTRAF